MSLVAGHAPPAAQDADRVYDSVDGLAAAWDAALMAMPEFHTWQQSSPALKPLLTGSLWMAQGPRCVTVVLDTGATLLHLRSPGRGDGPPTVGGQPVPTSVSTEAAGRRWDSLHRC